MKNDLELNLIYTQKQITKNETTYSIFHILYFFSDEGHIDLKILNKIYENYPKLVDLEDEFFFESLDELGHFASAVCSQIGAPEVFILSSEDYNQGLEATSDLRGFREIFRRYGSVISNKELSGKKKNIFSKLF